MDIFEIRIEKNIFYWKKQVSVKEVEMTDVTYRRYNKIQSSKVRKRGREREREGEGEVLHKFIIRTQSSFLSRDFEK